MKWNHSRVGALFHLSLQSDITISGFLVDAIEFDLSNCTLNSVFIEVAEYSLLGLEPMVLIILFTNSMVFVSFQVLDQHM